MVISNIAANVVLHPRQYSRALRDERLLLERHDLDPVAIRIGNERNITHHSALERLDEADAERLEALARLLDVGHGDADVT